MDEHPMMTCGHAANAVCRSNHGITYDPPIPSCAICSCTEVAERSPSLDGRMARCAYYRTCKSELPSHPERLAFFEYLGPGSRTSIEMCKCGFYKSAHNPKYSRNPKCRGFTEKGPQEFDRYYCGCHGWD
jgi:hypothetical protein